MADSGSKVSYFLVGLGIGAFVGILFAPRSGEETRDYLAQKAEEGKEYAQRKARELRERAEDIVERGKTVAVRQRENFGAAMDAGREAYQREKAKSQ
jgi:gas vesicle protein